ncbi:hypothetical protein LS684_22315 (plasmid) [Cytobacillus spongiae]|nr:hypothetical protein [Cytobacillus spongiae]MCA1062717.1 hypothetical protein [Rossellomorea aquimaris]NMH70056.1 hypothetical protein [Bacillus sp. RO3]UII58344.1 hypothetical protein LS684_22315 [Cytobacillus spongiae]WJV28618.1 hypothetical protein QTG56_16350 [Rossellomorea sp. AcN35-11]
MKNKKNQQHETAKKMAEQQMGEEIEMKSVAPSAKNNTGTREGDRNL